jgi:hypothetical protein
MEKSDGIALWVLIKALDETIKLKLSLIERLSVLRELFAKRNMVRDSEFTAGPQL